MLKRKFLFHLLQKLQPERTQRHTDARTDRQAHRQTYTQTRQKHYLSTYVGGNNSHSFKPNGKLYGYFDSMFHIRGLSPILRGLTIIKRSWNSGNLRYLVANTYCLNFFKIGGIWTFHGGGGERGMGNLYFTTVTLNLTVWPSYQNLT